MGWPMREHMFDSFYFLYMHSAMSQGILPKLQLVDQAIEHCAGFQNEGVSDVR